MPSPLRPTLLAELYASFPHQVQESAPLAQYTTAHVGGPADCLLVVNSAEELEKAALLLWKLELPFVILGGGSNIFFSDSGYRGVVIINHAKNVRVDGKSTPPTVWAESGANLGGIARKVALWGFSGLEWASGIPGSVGGAIYGNAGAHGADMAGNLLLAEILHRKNGRHTLTVEQMNYGYRTSILKESSDKAVILAARLRLERSTKEQVTARMEEFSARRRATQPPGASMGSMFKNPPGDYAGRLIDAAGLKGSRIGGMQISTLHANFFINTGQGTAADLHQLIELARQKVAQQFGVHLELEIERLGEFSSGG